MMGSIAFSKSGFYVIDGIINSTVDGDDVSKDVDYLMGFKFGIEKIHENCLIAGVTRRENTFIPSGTWKFSDKDRLVVFTLPESIEKIPQVDEVMSFPTMNRSYLAKRNNQILLFEVIILCRC